MFDIIVIGARCAGATTAMLLARKGLKVLVVDRSTFPSDVISTHFLWPHGASYLNRWGLLDRVLEVTPSHTVVNLVNEGIPLEGTVPEELLRQYFQLFHGDDSGIVQRYCSVRRRVLDKLLVDAAVEAGAEVREGFAVDELLEEDGRVVGIRGRTRDGTRVEERARVILGADGRNSFVARTLRLPKFDERLKCTFAYWTYVSGIPLDTVHIHRRGRLGLGLVPTNFGQHMVLVFGPSEWGTTFRRDVPGNFQKALDFISPELGELVRGGQREERFYGTLDQAAFLRPLFGPGWVLAGDAACFRDQCTATGMSHAFRDAELVSTALEEGLSGRKPLEEALKSSYESRRRGQVASAYYDFVCTLAEMRPPRHDDLSLYVALRSNPQETNRFIATMCDVAPVADFFQASNIFLLTDVAKESSSQHPIFERFEATSRTYLQNPFA